MKKSIKCNARIVSSQYKSTSYYGNCKYKVSFKNLDTNELIFAETGNNISDATYVSNRANIEGYKVNEHCVVTYHTTASGNNIIEFITPDYLLNR